MTLTVDTSVTAVVSATNVATTAAFTAPANTLILALVSGDGTTNIADTITMTDTAGLTWTLAKRQNAATTNYAGTVEAWWAQTAGGFTSKTITATNSASTAGSEATELRILMFAGYDTTTPIGATAGTDFASLTATHTRTITTTRANSWCWGKDLNYTRTATFTANASTAILAQGDDGDGDQYVTFAHSSVSTQPTVSAGTLLTLGGTYASTARGHIIAVEVLPAPPPTHVQIIEEQDAANDTGAVQFTLGGSTQVGDTILLILQNNYHTLADMLTPSGTAVGGTWTDQLDVDGGSLQLHAKVWTGVVTTAGGTIVTNWTTAPPDEERYAAFVALRPDSGYTIAFDAGAGTPTSASSTSLVAPSVTPSAGQTDDRLFCAWAVQGSGTTITPPAGMTSYTGRAVGSFVTYRAASEIETSSSATGTRTATAGLAGTWQALSVLIKAVVAATFVPPPAVPRLTVPVMRASIF